MISLETNRVLHILKKVLIKNLEKVFNYIELAFSNGKRTLFMAISL